MHWRLILLRRHLYVSSWNAPSFRRSMQKTWYRSFTFGFQCFVYYCILDVESLSGSTTLTPLNIASGLPQQPSVSDLSSQSNFFNPNVQVVPNGDNQASNQVQKPGNVFPNPSEHLPQSGSPIPNNPPPPPAVIGSVLHLNTPQPVPHVLGPMPGTPCRNGQVCQNGAICSLGFCRCPAGLKQLGDSCLPGK